MSPGSPVTEIRYQAFASYQESGMIPNLGGTTDLIIVRPKHECLSCLGLFVFKNKFGGIDYEV